MIEIEKELRYKISSEIILDLLQLGKPALNLPVLLKRLDNIYQIWAPLPKNLNISLRVRQVSTIIFDDKIILEKYFQTVKYRSNNHEALEVEPEITKKEFLQVKKFLENLGGKEQYKKRYTFYTIENPSMEFTADIDWSNKDIAIIECEYKGNANEIVIPDWLKQNGEKI